MTDESPSLPALLRRTQEEAAQQGHPMRLIDGPAFTVLIAGPVDAGKTQIIRTLLGDGTPLGEAALGPRPGVGTTVPVQYGFGRPALWLGIGGTCLAPSSWLQAQPDDPDLLRTPELTSVFVYTPAAVLRDWDVQFVDLPGTDGPGEPLRALTDFAGRQDTGMLYVVPSRGLSDSDTEALELLRAAPASLLVSLRESELTAEQAALYEIEVPWMASEVAMPVLVTKLAEPGPERDTLRDSVELLRGAGQPANWHTEVVDACVRSRKELRRDYDRAFRQILRGRRRDPLYCLAQLVQLAERGDAEVPIEDALSLSAQQAGQGLDFAGRREAVTATARKSTVEYNVQALRGGSAPPPPTGPGPADPVQLGSAYQQVRTDLLSTLGLIGGDGELGLTRSDREKLARTAEAVRADRLEIAVLGPFSAGKSTLINALLGAGTLPIGVGPKTAAVTRLVYAEQPQITPVWRDQVELTLLSRREQKAGVRVHEQEIFALSEWLRTGEVAAEDCTFQPFGPETAGQTAQLDGFFRLCTELSRDERGRLDPFAYPGSHDRPLPDGAIPGRVLVRKFVRVRRDWPGGLSITDALGQAGDHNSPLTLRLREIEVGYPHPLLRHVSVIDTPGTDAPVPHHRAMAYSAVRDKPQCAVIYCFPGFKVGGSADRANLAVLHEAKIGVSELSRFFFTITQEGKVPPKDRPEVRRAVVNSLRQLGITANRDYFVEVVHERNQDFRDLLTDLNHFVTRNKGTLVVRWIEQAQQVVADVRDRHKSRLAVLRSGEKARLRRVAELRDEAGVVAEITEEFRTSASWGEPYLRAKVAVKRATAAHDIDREIAALTTRSGFDGVAEILEPMFKDLNRWATKTVAGAGSGATNGLRAELGSRLPGRTVGQPVVAPGDVYFPATAILQAVDDAYWRGGWEKFKNWLNGDGPGQDDITTNRDRIQSAWNGVRRAGKLRLIGVREDLGGQLAAELDRLADGIGQEIADAGKPPSPHDEQVAAEGLRRSRDWAKRLADLATFAAGGER